MPATWVFDVDGTVLDSLTGSSVRPGTEELLRRLRAEGCRLLLWSAGGADYAQQRAAAHGLADRFDGFHGKDQRGPDGRFLAPFLPHQGPVTFVDDRPEDLPDGALVVVVSPYLAADPHDRAWRRVGLLAEGTGEE